MSDYTILVKNQAKVFLGGPPLVQMATGEIVDDETLGGADMHSKVSGVSDFLAKNEYDAIRIAREVIANLNYQKKTQLPKETERGDVLEPFYDTGKFFVSDFKRFTTHLIQVYENKMDHPITWFKK